MDSVASGYRNQTASTLRHRQAGRRCVRKRSALATHWLWEAGREREIGAIGAACRKPNLAQHTAFVACGRRKAPRDAQRSAKCSRLRNASKESEAQLILPASSVCSQLSWGRPSQALVCHQPASGHILGG
jgi:hypothetical protein